MAELCRTYEALLHHKQTISFLNSAQELASGVDGGKHLSYQRVWLWNALAYQYWSFHGEAVEARRCLDRGVELAFELRCFSYGRDSLFVHSVWLIFLLNMVRLDLRNGEHNGVRICSLKKLLAKAPWDPDCFGEGVARYFREGRCHAPEDEEILEFLRKKLKAEELLWLV